jgi:sigma-B regulation protein RsbU (phosphoserine phosphatase)
VNGGHTEALVLRSDGGIEWLPTTGVALGMFPGQRYDELRLRLAPGDLVALYSDGVTEALNPDDQEFGSQRLVDTLRRRAHQPASGIVAGVLAEVEAFCESAPQYDDITLLVFKREPTPE